MRKLYNKLYTLLLFVVAVIITTAPAWGCTTCGVDGCPPCPVIPAEPISTTLMIVGGALLSVRRYLKRRK